MALLQIAEPGQSAAPHQHKLAAGIDLGTTNSLVATVRSGEAKTLFNQAGQDMVPSVVRYTKDNVIVVHAAAAEAVPVDSGTGLTKNKSGFVGSLACSRRGA